MCTAPLLGSKSLWLLGCVIGSETGGIGGERGIALERERVWDFFMREFYGRLVVMGGATRENMGDVIVAESLVRRWYVNGGLADVKDFLVVRTCEEAVVLKWFR